MLGTNCALASTHMQMLGKIWWKLQKPHGGLWTRNTNTNTKSCFNELKKAKVFFPFKVPFVWVENMCDGFRGDKMELQIENEKKKMQKMQN